MSQQSGETKFYTLCEFKKGECVDKGGRYKGDTPGQAAKKAASKVLPKGKDVKKLPMSLGEALGYLEQSEVVRRGMPGEMYRLYHEYKFDEWARFMSTATDWDNDMYMECLP